MTNDSNESSPNPRAPVATGILAHEYLKARADAEGVPFELDQRFFINAAFSGITNFFGFSVEFCTVTEKVAFADLREPAPGFLRQWLMNWIDKPEESLQDCGGRPLLRVSIDAVGAMISVETCWS